MYIARELEQIYIHNFYFLKNWRLKLTQGFIFQIVAGLIAVTSGESLAVEVAPQQGRLGGRGQKHAGGSGCRGQ